MARTLSGDGRCWRDGACVAEVERALGVVAAVGENPGWGSLEVPVAQRVLVLGGASGHAGRGRRNSGCARRGVTDRLAVRDDVREPSASVGGGMRARLSKLEAVLWSRNGALMWAVSACRSARCRRWKPGLRVHDMAKGFEGRRMLRAVDVWRCGVRGRTSNLHVEVCGVVRRRTLQGRGENQSVSSQSYLREMLDAKI